MNKCAVALIYEGPGKPMPLCMTDDQRLKVLVKRQVLSEAEQALNGAEIIGDQVLIVGFKSNFEKLRNTLDLVIPPEMEDFFLCAGDCDVP